jgi:hypothetical protein
MYSPPLTITSSVIELCATLHATVTTRIDVLLCILTREIDIMAIFSKMGAAQDARVSICNVETARIACIPIGMLLHQIGVWWQVHVLLASVYQGEMPLISCGWGGKDIASREHTIGREYSAATK